MLYEPLRLNDESYIVYIHRPIEYCEHKQSAIELVYCIEGSFDIIINKKTYHMNAGDLAFIPPMTSHKIPKSSPRPENRCVIIIAGAPLLEESFKLLAEKKFPTPVFNLNTPKHEKLRELLTETYHYKQIINEASPLIVKGNIYKIFGYITENFAFCDTLSSNDIMNTIKIENALDYMYSNYSEKITIEEVAKLCGYSKTNFCRIFKNVTGNTFHNILNEHRIKMAQFLLSDNSLSIEEIAHKTGFHDSKSFWRVFKQVAGTTPNRYRNQKK